MHSPSLKTAVRRIRSLAGPPDAPPDADLLARFRATRDDRAFAALVARHGPAVLGVCRRVLADPHAAEDAFQATFLVLARRPAAVRKAASLGCWLHGVAFRVATKLRGQLARRPRPVPAVEVAADPRDDVLWRDVRRVLDEEVNRLPDRLRLPVYLCYYEGKTRDEAAEALGWKLTTLRGRLEDGRLRLRTRLALRGVELSAALLAVSAVADGLAVGDALVETTVRAAGGTASEAVRSLASGLALSGAVGKAKLTAGVVLLALGLGSTLLVYRGEAGQTPGPDPKAATPPEKEPLPAKLPKPPEWGDPAGDFRLRLRPVGPVKVGDVPELVLDAKYGGKEKWALEVLPENAEVELDGKWYTLPAPRRRGGRALTEIAPGAEHPAWATVRPDGTWYHLRDKPHAAGDPGEATKELVPFRLTPGKHTIRVAYRFGNEERAVSNPITVEVAPDGWGESAGGVKARLRVARTKLKPGEPLTFELDLRNDGVKTWELVAIPFECEVLVDDEPYKFHGPLDYKAMRKELKPGAELVPFVTGTVDADWKANRHRDNLTDWLEPPPPVYLPFRPPPGRHTVRVAFPLDNKVRPLSNPVEIEVEAPPLDPAVKALALAADRIWVVPSPTREKPVPEPVAALKGPPRNNPSVFDLRLLPADDPKAKWIIFLRAEEEGKPTPAVQVLPWAQWSRPYTPEGAAAIRQAVRPADWGPEAGGLRLGLRLRQPEMAAGGPVVAEVTIGNVGPHAMTVDQLRFNIYDYWPRTRFEVTDPAGAKWVLEKPAGAIDEADSPAQHDLQPGETYTHATRLDRWAARPAGAGKVGQKPPANLFAAPGAYTITARHSSASPVTEEAWAVARASNPAGLTVRDPAQEAAWGEAVNGLRAGIRLAKAKFGPDEPLSFVLDLKNEGTEFRRVEVGQYHCGFILDGRKVALDGQRYAYAGPPGLARVFKDLPPQAEERGFLTATPGEGWVRKGPGPVDVPYRRPVGKHILAGTYQVDEKTWVTTRPVEFEVADDYGEPVGGMAARVRMPRMKFPAGEALTFDLDLKSTADKEAVVPINPERCELHLDGVTYSREDRRGARANNVSLPPRMEYAPFINFDLGGDWSAVADGRPGKPGPLPLTPGKHRLRVAYRVADNVKPQSREVEFEVTADEWGDPADGIRARLRVRNPRLAAGERLLFDLDLKNDGPGDRKVVAAGQRCVLTLDGRPYHTPVELDGPRLVELKAKAGAVWFLTVGPDEGWGWVAVADARVPYKLTPGKHTLSVAYPVGDKTRAATRPVEFEVAAPDEWGEPAAGIRARVRLAKPTFKPGEPLAFEFDLKNTGDQTITAGPIPMYCRIHLGGATYQYTAPLSYPTADRTLTPGREFVPWVKVETNQWWTTVRGDQAVPLALTPGKHKFYVSYPLAGVAEPASPVVEFEVTDEAKAPDLAAVAAAADRIFVADIEFVSGVEKLTPRQTLKGPTNLWPAGLRIDIPRGADIVPGEVPNDPVPGEKRSAGRWILFLKAQEDGVEVPKLTPAVARGWYRPATDKEIAAVVAALPKPPEAGPEKNGLTLALRPKSTTIRAGDEVRLEVVLTNTGKDARRILQQRYNVYDYWPFLTFTVTGPDGQQATLRKPEGQFDREDFIDDIELKAGEGYAHAVRLDRWPNALRGRTAPGAAPREPFSRPGRYTVTVTYKAPDTFQNLRPDLVVKKWPFFIGELTSNPITVEVKAEVGAKRRKAFDAQPDRFHLTLSRWSDRTPADQFDAVLHLQTTEVGADRTGIRAERIVAGEATKLIEALAADGFFDRASDGEKAHERAGGGFLLAISRGDDPATRLRLAYPWTEETVRRLMKLAPCLNGTRPDRVKELLAPLADTVPPWGEAVSGLASRLHVPDPATPTRLELEVRNRGTRSFQYVDHAAWVEVEVDGVWYEYSLRPVDYLSSELKPGSEPRRLTLTLDGTWVRKGAKASLDLKPGKHKFRAAYVFGRPGDRDGEPLHAVSQPVEIEVPKSPFDLVRPVTEPGQGPLLYVVLTEPGADQAALEGLVAKHAAAALAAADRQKFARGNVVFLVREAVGHDRGHTTGFSREQLEEIQKAAPAVARSLVGRHVWTTGMLPAK